MRTTIDIPATLGERVVEGALEGLVRVAAEEHRAHRLPPLYRSGIRYEREHGTEDWQTPTQLLASGRGDCEDLAAYRCGELRASGVDPDCRVVIERTGPRTLHAIVQRGDGSIEDPSRALGMRGRGDGVERPGMLVGVEPEHTWAELRRRCARGELRCAPTLADALDVEVGVGPMPVLDTIARAAQGALSAVVPSHGSRVVQPSVTVARDVAMQLRADGLDVTPGEVLALAAQLARVVSAEARRIAARERARAR